MVDYWGGGGASHSSQSLRQSAVGGGEGGTSLGAFKQSKTVQWWTQNTGSGIRASKDVEYGGGVNLIYPLIGPCDLRAPIICGFCGCLAPETADMLNRGIL